MSHTPGPWKVRHTPGPWNYTEEHGWEVWSNDEDEPEVRNYVATGLLDEADARLIAAAPELLQALTRILAYFGRSAAVVRADVLEQGRSAIRKAIGESLPLVSLEDR